jgi:hypothetical protein
MRTSKIKLVIGAYRIAEAELVLEGLALLAPWLFDVVLPVLPLPTFEEF